MQTRDQVRAAGAFEKIKEIKSTTSPEFSVKYGGLCLKMPTLVQQNGLCQAVSFYEAKSDENDPDHRENEQSLYLRDLSRLVLKDNSATVAILAARARGDDFVNYLQLSREVMQCALWLKRYAEAVLRVKAGAEGD